MANIKKLSVATVFGKIDLQKLVNAPDQKLKIMRVIGNAVGHKSGQSQYGDWKALVGLFEATNLETGEAHRSSQLFLPDVALTPILVQLSQPGVQGVEFAIDVTVAYEPNAKAGGSAYNYSFDTLLEPDQNDPITRMKAKLVALPAPTPAAAPPVKSGKGRK